MSEIHWNDIVKTYDKQFHLLEAARSEYAKLISSILSSLASRFEVSAVDGIELSPAIVQGEFGKSFFSTSIFVMGTEWCRVVTKIASPWSGEAGRFLVAIESVPQKDFLPPTRFDRQSFVVIASDIESWKAASANIVSIEGAQNWLYLDSIDLAEPDPLQRIHSGYSSALECGKIFASKCAENSTVIFKVRSALRRTLSEFMADPASSAIESTIPTSENGPLGSWQGITHIQFNSNDLLNIWIGVRPNELDLVFGHSPDKNGVVGIVKSFANKVAVNTFTIGNFPAGILMSDNQLIASTENEIFEKLISTVRLFYTTVIELKNQPSIPPILVA